MADTTAENKTQDNSQDIEEADTAVENEVQDNLYSIEEEEVKKPACEIHDQPLEFLCETCHKVICFKCIGTLHGEEHDVLELHTIYEAYQRDSAVFCKEAKSLVKESRKLAREQEKEILKTIDRRKEIITKRLVDALTIEIENEVERQKKNCRHYFEDVDRKKHAAVEGVVRMFEDNQSFEDESDMENVDLVISLRKQIKDFINDNLGAEDNVCAIGSVKYDLEMQEDFMEDFQNSTKRPVSGMMGKIEQTYTYEESVQSKLAVTVKESIKEGQKYFVTVTSLDAILQKPKTSFELPHEKHFHLCTRDDSIYVTDAKAGLISCYCIDDGAFRGSIKPATSSRYLMGIAAFKGTSSDNVVLVVSDFHVFKKLFICQLLSPCKKIINQGIISLKGEPSGLTSDAGERLYVCIPNRGAVRVFQRTGTMTFQPTITCQVIDMYPWKVCVDQNLNRFIVSDCKNSELAYFSNEGRLLLHVKQEKMLGLQSPGGMVVIPDGNMVLTNWSNNTIVVVSTEGGLMKTYGKDEDKFNKPQDVCMQMNSGKVVILDSCRIQVYSK